jgi:hypothetical protein
MNPIPTNEISVHYRIKRTLALSLVAMAATTATAQADIATGVYRMAPGHATTKAVDVLNFGQDNGAKVIQNPSNGQLTQRWRIRQTGAASSGAKFYSLSPQHAQGMCLDVAGASTLSGARIELQSCSSARASQRWHIFPRNPGLFQITNRNSSMSLQVPSASQTNGRQLIQGTGGAVPEAPHKQFKMTKLSN